MTINTSKSCLTAISRQLATSGSSYEINNTPPIHATKHEYLGLTFASDLKWNTRTDKSDISSSIKAMVFATGTPTHIARGKTKNLQYPSVLLAGIR